MSDMQILLAGWIVLVALGASLATWVHKRVKI